MILRFFISTINPKYYKKYAPTIGAIGNPLLILQKSILAFCVSQDLQLIYISQPYVNILEPLTSYKDNCVTGTLCSRGFLGNILSAAPVATKYRKIGFLSD